MALAKPVILGVISLIVIGAITFLWLFGAFGTLYNFGQVKGGNFNCFGAGSHFSCNSARLTTTGNIKFELEQYSGNTFYNVELACGSETNYSFSFTSYENLTWDTSNIIFVPLNNVSNGFANSTLPNEKQANVTGLPCYGKYGLLGSQQPGTIFLGRVLVNYTLNPGTVSPSNKWNTNYAALVSAKVS